MHTRARARSLATHHFPLSLPPPLPLQFEWSPEKTAAAAVIYFIYVTSLRLNWRACRDTWGSGRSWRAWRRQTWSPAAPVSCRCTVGDRSQRAAPPAAGPARPGFPPGICNSSLGWSEVARFCTLLSLSLFRSVSVLLSSSLPRLRSCLSVSLSLCLCLSLSLWLAVR